MQKYFVAKDGIQKGPWSLEEIRLNIQNNIIAWNDYIFDDTSEDWIFLFEFPALTDAFNLSFKNPPKSKIGNQVSNHYEERIWYILKQNENYGPFCYKDLIQMLRSKTLFEHDFIWRPGKESWKRLSELEEFSSERLEEVFNHFEQKEFKSEKIFFRRRFSRANYKCELLIHDNQKVYTAYSIEISAGGASFSISDVVFPIDSHVHLHFKPGGDVPPFNALCKIVSKVGDLYGVSFVNVSSAAKESIEKFAKKPA
jgi:hypothetical protein